MFHCVTIPHFLCTFIYRWTHLHCSCILAMMNNASKNIRVPPLWDPVLRSFGCIPRNGITASYGSSISNFLRTFQAVFQSGCTILHSYQTGQTFQFLHILNSTCYPFFCFVDRNHPNRYEMILICILIYISWWLAVPSTFSGTYCPFVCLLQRNI